MIILQAINQQYNSLLCMHIVFLGGDNCGCTSPRVCCFAICKMLNACNYLLAFYGGDLNSEGLTSKVALWSIY